MNFAHGMAFLRSCDDSSSGGGSTGDAERRELHGDIRYRRAEDGSPGGRTSKDSEALYLSSPGSDPCKDLSGNLVVSLLALDIQETRQERPVYH